MALTFRQVNCSDLALSSSQLISLDIQMSKYGSFMGCVQHIYSPRAQIASKTMEIHGNFHQPSLWYQVAREYYSYGLEYFSGPNMIK